MSVKTDCELSRTDCGEQGHRKVLCNGDEFVDSIAIVNKIKGFPYRLHAILSQPSIQDVMCWTPSGDAFCILDQNRFVEFVLQKHFQNIKFESFARKMRRWGFKKVNGDKRAPIMKGAVFQCQFFQREKLDLCKFMCDERKQKKAANKSTVSLVKTRNNGDQGCQNVNSSGRCTLLESSSKLNPATTLSKTISSKSTLIFNFQPKCLIRRRNSLASATRLPLQQPPKHQDFSRVSLVSRGSTCPNKSTNKNYYTSSTQVSNTSFSTNDGFCSGQSFVRTHHYNHEMLPQYHDKIPLRMSNPHTTFTQRSHFRHPLNCSANANDMAHSYLKKINSEEEKDQHQKYVRATMRNYDEELALVRRLRILKERRLILEEISFGQYQRLKEDNHLFCSSRF